jgi:hypothetical protein
MQNYTTMKNNMRLIFLVVFSVVLTNLVLADKIRNNTGSKTQDANKINAETCSPATGHTDLDINNVRARINTGGDMWWDLINTAKYEIPKGSGHTSMFAGALWLGGIDANGQLKVAALEYRQSGNDFWTGPLTTDGTASVDAATCEKYDKHFVITRKEVDEFIAHCTGPNGSFVATSDYPSPPASILNWPAHGDVSKKQSYYLAPFFDADGNGVYEPENGDYPYYDVNNSLCPTNKENLGHPPATTAEGNGILVDQVLKGDQTLWWVFNDKGNIHTESKGAPIGFEIRAQAFAFATNDEINNMTFYSYEIINRSTYRLTETYMSQWADTDLGNANDDYVGCDVKRGLGYCYNGKDVDGSGTPEAYGAQPPAVGMDFFQGPYMDPDGIDNPKYTKVVVGTDTTLQQICDVSINGVNFGNGIVDDERFGMRRFIFFTNATTNPNPATSDPSLAIEYYDYLKGIWKDGTQMMWGGNGHVGGPGVCGPDCDFMFPGDTDPCNWGTGGQPPNCTPNWTEKSVFNAYGDRRFLQSAGPFTLEPGSVNYITVGIPWARATSGGAWASVELLRTVDDKCQRLFDNCFKVVDGPDAPDLTIQELNKELILYVSNKPGTNNYKEKYQEWDPSIISPTDSASMHNHVKYDSIYRFEGYQIFQLSDASVSVADIHNPDKARLIEQCDVKNFDKNGTAIGPLVNYYFDDAIGANTPVQEVDGANAGIVHSFRITDDQFASGDKRLINHKQYYFLALAYGYNNYLTYTQDPAVAGGLSGQKKPYLAGRKNIQVTTGIPHDPSPEANGTVQNSQYGDGPKITRIEGQGNGGNVLDLTPESEAQILRDGYMLTPQYENSKSPVKVKVIDPLKIIGSSYTLYFDSVYSHQIKPISHQAVDAGGDTATMQVATWILKDNNSGKIYHSDTSTLYDNEQLFLDQGLSVEILQVFNVGLSKVGALTSGTPPSPVNVNYNLAPNNGFLESSITYADSSKQWLGGIADVDGGGFWNWIRSGTTHDNVNGANSDYDYSATTNSWIDPQKNYQKIVGGTWAPYRLCATASVNPSDPTHPGYGVAWKNATFQLNKLENIASVNIVLTPDKSKWSRCPVLETCDEANVSLTEGNTMKFDLRVGQSVDKDGNPDGSGTGMGWFPGYAINVETGERLNIMYGENSWLVGENGRDMKFNPTSHLTTDIGDILWGGEHFVYIMGHNADDTASCPAYDAGNWIYGKLFNPANPYHNFNKRNVFKDVMYVGIPVAIAYQEWLSNEVKIRIRVSKPYKRNYSTHGSTTPSNNNFPMYQFSTDDLKTVTDNAEAAKNALDLINVVPNPYYGYSGYETNQLDNRIKITNLPVKCTVSIYTVNGTLVRQYTRDNAETTDLDWDLKNTAGIPIAGGIYLIHVKADGIGERTLKWFGTLRPIDLNAF